MGQVSLYCARPEAHIQRITPLSNELWRLDLDKQFTGAKLRNPENAGTDTDDYRFDALPISWRDFFLQTDRQFGYYADTSGATPEGAFRFRHS
jgi:hypothetical protein